MKFIKLLATLGLVGSLGACVVHERTYGRQRYHRHHGETATVIIHRH